MTPAEKKKLRRKWNSHSSRDSTGSQRLCNTENRITRSLDSFSRELRLFSEVHDRRHRRFARFNILRSHETLSKESLVRRRPYVEDRDLGFPAVCPAIDQLSGIFKEEESTFLRGRCAWWRLREAESRD